MPAPNIYTEKTLADFMNAELGKVATVLVYVVGALDAGSYQEAVNESLLRYGAATVNLATDIMKIRALARVEAWRKAVNDLSTNYRFSSPDGSFERETVFRQAVTNLERAQGLAAPYDNLGLYVISTSRVIPVNDPYRYIPEEERTM